MTTGRRPGLGVEPQVRASSAVTEEEEEEEEEVWHVRSGCILCLVFSAAALAYSEPGEERDCLSAAPSSTSEPAARLRAGVDMSQWG